MSRNKFVEVYFSADSYYDYEGDILISLLGEKGFDSFIDVPNGIKAYITNELFTDELITACLSEYEFMSDFKWTIQHIEETDWNAVWEKESFKPIVIGNRCVIHSPEHIINTSDFDFDIILNPRMSFGSGYHETTSMIVEKLMDLDLRDKEVIDVGTGTGILSIMSSKLGAKKIIGIEIDNGAYINALENADLNNTDNFAVIHGDANYLEVYSNYDFLLANINRNIIINDIDKYSATLKVGGKMLLSGFYSKDTATILEAAQDYNLVKQEMLTKNDWALLVLKKV